jgi:copper chaperone CopZ
MNPARPGTTYQKTTYEKRKEPEMSTRIYTVDGMSCGHCVSAITGEVTKVSGVSDVEVDLAARTVTVTGETLDDTAIRDAIDEAGYSVVDERVAG